MQFYELYKDLIGYIPERLSFLSGFFYEALPFVLMACALFTAFFGLKYLAAWNGVTFFFLGLSLSASALLPKRDLTSSAYWLWLGVCLVIGIVCAVFSKYLFRVQLVVTTFFAIFASLPSYILHFGELFSKIVSAVVALALAFLTVKYKYIIMIFVTSFSGSFVFWEVMEDRYGAKYKVVFAILMGIAAAGVQVLMNYEQLKETYKDVKKKYKITRDTGEKAYDEVKDKVETHEVVKHYDLLIDEGNDPTDDPPELREYMDTYDGKKFIESLELDKTKRVLEIGVGTGRLALQVADKCKEFTGIDVSPKTIERAGENLSGFENVHLVCGDFNSHKFKGTYDVIYSSLTFMHFRDKQKVIDKVASMLDNGGLFVLSIDKNQSEYIDMGSRKIKVHPDNANTIKQCLKNAKLTLSLHYETERAEIIAAKKIKQL